MKKYRKYISYRQLQWSNSKFVNILSDGTVQSVTVEEEVPSFSVSVPAPSNVTMAVPPRFLSSTVAGLSKRPRSESDEDSPSSSVSYPANDSNSPQVTPLPPHPHLSPQFPPLSSRQHPHCPTSPSPRLRSPSSATLWSLSPPVSPQQRISTNWGGKCVCTGVHGGLG